MAAIDDLKLAVGGLVTVATTTLADIAARLTTLAANQADPALTAQIEAEVTQINAVTDQLKAADPGAPPTA